MLLGWSINLFALTVVASLLGFYALGGAAAGIAQFFAVVFFALFTVTVSYGLVWTRKTHHRVRQ